MNRLIIIGGGGHGKVIADIAIKNGYRDICFVDDKEIGEVVGFPVIGSCECIKELNDGNTDFVIGIGNNATRKIIAEKYNINWITLIHPSAEIAFNAKIGTGTVIMANAIVNSCAIIGKHCIINSSSVVEHDNEIGDYVHISPKAALGGTVKIGELTHIGIGATIKNNIDICLDCNIGAGAVVVKDIKTSGIYIGNPAKKRV